jgi:multicomponent Na+:H+ antiporter subunit E
MMHRLRKIPRLVAFIGLYLSDLLLAALKIAWDVVTIRELSHPKIVAMPLDARSDAEITLVANLITFSPGTMVVELAEDRSIMYVHAMFVDDEAETVAHLKNHVERRILELMR